MQEGFIKFGKNKVANVQHIEDVLELKGKIVFALVDFQSMTEVDPEYEQAWRDRFDLNDDKPKGEIPF